jgi:hypothetical protein
MCLSGPGFAKRRRSSIAALVPFATEVLVLRDSYHHWWQRLFIDARVPAYVVVRPDAERHCPDCRAAYDVSDRYCPSCHIATPEWRFG